MHAKQTHTLSVAYTHTNTQLNGEGRGTIKTYYWQHIKSYCLTITVKSVHHSLYSISNIYILAWQNVTKFKYQIHPQTHTRAYWQIPVPYGQRSANTLGRLLLLPSLCILRTYAGNLSLWLLRILPLSLSWNRICFGVLFCASLSWESTILCVFISSSDWCLSVCHTQLFTQGRMCQLCMAVFTVFTVFCYMRTCPVLPSLSLPAQILPDITLQISSCQCKQRHLPFTDLSLRDLAIGHDLPWKQSWILKRWKEETEKICFFFFVMELSQLPLSWSLHVGLPPCQTSHRQPPHSHWMTSSCAPLLLGDPWVTWLLRSLLVVVGFIVLLWQCLATPDRP